jgi:transcriptional regulator with XRE-family HTH domain
MCACFGGRRLGKRSARDRCMDVGRQLRDARLQAGLSQEQIAEATKITLGKIEALEADAFEQLPQGIYLDGIVRAYADEVGLDGNALVAALRRQPQPLEAPTAIEPTTASAAVSSAFLSFPSERELTAPVEPVHRDTPAELPTAYNDPDVYAAPELYMLDEESSASMLPPPSRPRGAARFVTPVLAFVAAAGIGAYLYEINRPFARHDEIALPAVSDTPAVPAAAPDNQAVSSANHHQDETPASPEHSVNAAPPPAAPSRASSPVPESTDRAAPSTPGPEAVKPSGPALSGLWTMNTRVESSSYRDFEGLQLGYRLQLHQEGNRITGEGVKTLENGRELAGGAKTAIEVEGTYVGHRVTLTFTERGTQRTTGGKMILDVSDDGVLRGRFSSSAARSSGTAEVRRLEG